MNHAEFAKHVASIAHGLNSNSVHHHSLRMVIQNAVLGYVLTQAPHFSANRLKHIVDNHCGHLEFGKLGLRQAIAHIVEDCLAQEFIVKLIIDKSCLNPAVVYKFELPPRGSVECSELLKWLINDLKAIRYTATETFISGQFVYCFQHNNTWAITNAPDNHGTVLFNPDNAVEAKLNLSILKDPHVKRLNSNRAGSHFNNYLLRGEARE